MLFPLVLLTVPMVAPADTSLLATVPDDAYFLVHCRDVSALRARAEQNDWVRLLGSPEGAPLQVQLAREVHAGTRSDLDELLAMADAMEGEAVFFDTGSVAGFATVPPADPAPLVELMRAWLPEGDEAARRTFELEGGAVELVAWPDSPGGASGRAGHFAALVVHPWMLALYSGDDSASVVAALTASVTGFGAEERAPLVRSYHAAGGGVGGGIELYLDFTPLVDKAEEALVRAVEDVLPDPTNLLGLEEGTWIHASADVLPGTLVDCRARVHLPADTLVDRLADTFHPLPGELPADLPTGVWGLYTWNWDVARFYRLLREAYEQADLGEGLEVIDAGVSAAKGLAGVDPVVDVLDQLAGDFALYLVAPESEAWRPPAGDFPALLLFGMHAGLVDGDAFLEAFEKLIEVGDLSSALDLDELAGVDVYTLREESDFDGGLAFLPDALSVAATRRVLERGLLALTRVEGAGLDAASATRAALTENAGACYLFCAELSPLRAWVLPEWVGDLQLPPPQEGGAASDPFDSQLVGSARRTADGFELRVSTR